MSQQNKPTYYPSNFTLTLMDSFGSKPIFRRNNKTLQASKSQSKMPPFARQPKRAYDKQNLLEQLQHEKNKKHIMSHAHSQLVRAISKPKIKIERPEHPVIPRSRQTSLNHTLKREIEQLITNIQKQSTEIATLKTSKKYNRYTEMTALKEVYLQQIAQVKRKIRSFRHQLKQRRRIHRQQKKRVKDIRVMNHAVEERIDTQNMQITEQIQAYCLAIQQKKLKQLNYKRERQRLVKQIKQLQQKTGKVYLANPEPTSNKYKQAQQYQTSQPSYHDTPEDLQQDEQQHIDLSSQSSSSSLSDERYDPAEPDRPRKATISF